MANENRTTLAVVGNPDAAELATIERMADRLVRSGFAKGARTGDQAVALILMGREIGLPAMQSLSSIHVIEGKPTASAQLIGALLARGGVTWDVTRHDATGCVIVFRRRGFADVTSSFVAEDAFRAGLAGKNVWRTYPCAMYFSRAMTEGARMIGPDLLCGIAYTPEELGAHVNADGEPVADAPAPHRAEARVDPPAVPAPTPRMVAPAPAGREPGDNDFPPDYGASRPAAKPYDTAGARKSAMARCRALGLTIEQRRGIAIGADLPPSSKNYDVGEWKRFHRALDAEEESRSQDGGEGDPLPPEFAPREPGDDDEAMAAVSAPPSAALVGKALGARGVQVSASPATPPGRAGSKRDERIAELRAMLPRMHTTEALVAHKFCRGTTKLDELDDQDLERAASWAYDMTAAQDGA